MLSEVMVHGRIELYEYADGFCFKKFTGSYSVEIDFFKRADGWTREQVAAIMQMLENSRSRRAF